MTALARAHVDLSRAPDEGIEPPSDGAAEANVLAGILQKPEAHAALLRGVDPSVFYSGDRAWIARGIIAIDAVDRVPTPSAVKAWLAGSRRFACEETVDDLLGFTVRGGYKGDLDIVIELAHRRSLALLYRTKVAELALGRISAADAKREIETAHERIVARSEIERAAVEAPTLAEPMRGLDRLAAVAILGRNKLLELAARPVVYLWQDIAIAGIVVVIAGGPGCGKTTLLFLILAARLNLGEPVDLLGRRVTPAPEGRFVVLIEGEHGPTSTTRKLVKSLGLLGIGDEALDRIIVVARKSVRIGSIEWDEIGELVAAGLVSDIALDTLARVAPADANDEQAQVAIFDVIANAIDRAPSEETKPVVWCVAHTRKGALDDLEGVSGSTQRVGQADTVLMVQPERRDGRVISSKVTFAKLREEPDEYPAPVEYTVTPDGVVVVGAAKSVDDRPLEERIAERLALGPQTASALGKVLGRSYADVQSAITNLFAARQIVSAVVTVRGKPAKAFALAREPKSGATLARPARSKDVERCGETER